VKMAHLMKGKSLAQLKRWEDAAESFLDAIGLKFIMPMAHYGLGDALEQLQNYEGAEQAYKNTIHLMPDHIECKKRLIHLYDHILNKPQQSQLIKASMPDESLSEILIVSGLPRSGTSMMMQMLQAGGIEPFTDNLRVADQKQS
jgi:tetratricopeptide (TPR) repeat protein